MAVSPGFGVLFSLHLLDVGADAKFPEHVHKNEEADHATEKTDVLEDKEPLDVVQIWIEGLRQVEVVGQNVTHELDDDERNVHPHCP